LIEKERVNETLTKTNDPDSRRKSPVKHIDMFIRDFYQYKVNIYVCTSCWTDLLSRQCRSIRRGN